MSKKPWDPHFFARSEMFRIFDEFWPPSPSTHLHEDWPTLQEMQSLLHNHGPITNESGAKIDFVEQGPKPRQFSEHYEVRIYERGEIQTRTHDWHDFFNALTWVCFPQAKVAINAQHYKALLDHKTTLYTRNKRTPQEDLLSIYNENGIAIVSGDPKLSDMIHNFQWKSLFWEHRDTIKHKLRIYLFGHALYEKCMVPYVGLTGHARIYETGEAFFHQPLSRQRHQVDTWIAKDFSDPHSLWSTRQLAPFPLLGYPGLVPDSEYPDYYDNTRYFRTGRSLSSTSTT